MNSNNETKRSGEELTRDVMSTTSATNKAHIVDKVLNSTNNQLLSSKTAMNGLNGCPKDEIDGHSSESSTGIRLLFEAANAVETNGLKKCRQPMNGLISTVNNESNPKSLINLSNNSISGSSGPTKTNTNSCCSCHPLSATSSHSSATCCRTSSTSLSPSATTSCCSTSATLSCDIIPNQESVVHRMDDNNKDVNCLTNRLSTDLNINELNDRIVFVNYESERQMPDIMRLIQKDLSEPYSIYTYRYFIHNWPHLCFLAMGSSKCVGAIVCKLDLHKKMVRRGYIAMLAVDENYRKRKIGSNLVLRAIQAMIAGDADEVVLETEVTNKPALQLYENLGFVRDKRLFRYYLNGVDALRLKLWLK